MANINSVITYNANLSPAQAQIKALTGQIAGLSAAFNTLDKAALSAQKSLASGFAANVGQIGGFTAQTVKATDAVTTFGKQLVANRLTMREYFREAITGYTRQQSMLRQLAAQQVRYQQSIAVPTGAGQAMLLTPQSIDAMASKTALASQRFSIFNELINKGSTQMLNWGKNTQWAGRQLMVGFTLPLALFTATLSKQFRDLDKELTRFQKVYGSDLGGAITESTARMREQVKQLAYDISQTYGIAAKDTAALAADIAATGAEGEQLMSSVQQTTRLAVLGEVDRQEAMKATLALQSAFKMNTNELAESINFLNAVENQTSATLEDLATAIPKVGPVIRSLGGDVRDLATLLVAMREGGIPAAEAANALKSGLASLINPTKQASEVAQKFGIDLVGIVEANKGQLMPTIYAMRNALSGLDDFARSRVIEQIFGKYQFARISALFDNIGRTGSQTQSVIELASKSSTELAAVANQEIKTLTESTAVKFQRTLEQLKNALMPIGQVLTESLIPILDIAGRVMETFSTFFSSLPDSVKGLAKWAVGLTALAGPAIMLVGLFANLTANGLKFGMSIVRLGARMTGLKIERFELLDDQVMAAKLGVDNLTSSFTTQETALKRLTGVLSTYEASLRRLTTANPALFIPGAIPGRGGSVPIKRQSGSSRPEFVPGSGRGDKIPAMLEPGEFIVNRKAAEKYAPVLLEMNRGTLQGFAEGTQENSVSLTGGQSRILAPYTMFAPDPYGSGGFGMSREFFQASDDFELSLRASAITAKAIEDGLRLSRGTVDRLSVELEPITTEITDALRVTATEMTDAGQDATHISQVIERATPRIDAILSNLPESTQTSVRKILSPTMQQVESGGYYRVPSADIDPQTGQPTRTTIRSDRRGQAGSFYSRVKNVAEKIGLNRTGMVQAHLPPEDYSLLGPVMPLSGGGTGLSPELRAAAEQYIERKSQEIIDAFEQGLVESLETRSPSKKMDRDMRRPGKDFGDGAVQGFVKGYKSSAAGKPIIAGPVGGGGIESISNAQKIAQADKSILAYKEAQSKFASQRVISEQQVGNINAEIYKLEEQYKRGQITIIQLHERRAALLQQRKVFEDQIDSALQKEKIYQDKINEQKQRIANADASQARSEEEEAKKAAQRAVASMTAPGGVYGPGGYAVFGNVGKRPAPEDIESGPGQSLIDAMGDMEPDSEDAKKKGRTGRLASGGTNALLGLSMLTSTMTMFSGASSDAANKVMMLSTAVMTLTMAAQAFSGMGLMGAAATGVSKVGGGMKNLGSALAPAGRHAAPGLLSRGLTGMGGALAGGGAAAAGTVAAVAIPLIITAAGLYMYKKSLDEAKEKANAAFAEPTKTAEFFGKTVDGLGNALDNIQAAGASKELSSINSELRMAVSEDYAGLIEKLKTSVTTVGAADLGSAYTKMIVSGMSAEEAQDAIKAIAAEAGYKGGVAYVSAFSNGLLEAKTIEEAYQQTIGKISPQAISDQQTAKNQALKQQALSGAGLYGRSAPLVASGNFKDVLAGGPEFVQALKSSIEISQTAPELVAQNLDKIRESYLALNEDAGDIFGMGTSAREMAFDEFKNMMGELDDPVINQLLDDLQNSTAETQSLAIQMTALGVPLTEAKNAAGQFDDALARAAIENATRMATLEKAVTDAKQALVDFAESATIESQLNNIENAVERTQEKLQDYTKSREEEREGLEESFELEQKGREDALEAMQDEMDARKEIFDEEMDQLDEKSKKIRESSDTYIESLQKNQRADSFYAQQRKTSLSALQKLASGDVFGFLQEREQMSQDAQDYSYDQMIGGIEERRDLELDAIDETREKKQKEQEEYEKMMKKRIDLLQEEMDMQSEIHEQNMKDFDEITQTEEEELQKRLNNRTSKNEKAKDLIDGIKEGEIQSYREVTKVFGEQTAKRYQELVKAELAALQLKLQSQVAVGDVNLGEAERQLLDIYNSLVGAEGYQGPEASRRGAVTTYSSLQNVLGLPGFITRPPTRNAGGGKITGPGGPKSDVIPALLSNGEYVIQASSVKKYGTDLMHTINAGKYAYGGYISADRAETAAQGNRYGGKPKPQYSGGTPTYSGGYSTANAQATQTSGYKSKIWKQPKIKTGGGFLGDMIFEGLRSDFADFINTTILGNQSSQLQNLIGTNISGNRFYSQRSEVDKAIGNALFGLNFAPLPFIGAAAKALSSFGKIGASLGSKSSTILNRIPELPIPAIKAAQRYGPKSLEFKEQKKLWMNQSFPRMAIRRDLESGQVYGTEYMSAETKAALLKSIPLTSRNPILFHGSPNPTARFSTPTQYQLEKTQLGPYGIYNTDNLYAASTYAKGSTGYVRPGSIPAVMMTESTGKALNLMPYGKNIPSKVIDAIDSRLSRNPSLNKPSRQDIDKLVKESNSRAKSGEDRINFINTLAEKYIPNGMTEQEAMSSGLFQSIKNEIGQAILDAGYSSIRHQGGSIMGDRAHTVNILLDVLKHQYKPFYRFPKMDADSSLMANGGLVQKFADGGLVESMEKYFPNGGHQFYPGWNRFNSWAGGKPGLVMMHHTAGNWGQGELDYFAKDWMGKPVVQGFIRKTGTAHTIAGGDTGLGSGVGDTELLNKVGLDQAAELISLAGGANRAAWQIEVQSLGQTKDFTSGQFESIARMTAAIRDWAGWPSFKGRIINHKDWAWKRGKPDTLYDRSVFEANAEKIWEQGGGESSGNNNTPGNPGKTGRKGSKNSGDPSSIESRPEKGLFGILSLIGSAARKKPGSGGGGKPGSGANAPTTPSTAANAAIAYARQQLGKPYSFNAQPPDSWDCSKLTAWSWNEAAGKSILTPYSHTQATQLNKRTVGLKGGKITGLSIGDVLYFKTEGPSGGHTSIYAGGDKIVQASSPSTGVITSDLNSPWNTGINPNTGKPRFQWAGPPKGYATGGFISGPGGPRSDVIPAMLSNGEYVVKASSVAKYGKGFMDQINSGQLLFGGGGMIPKYASGGMVGSAAMPAFNMPEMSSTSVGMTNNNYAGNSSSNSSNTNVKVIINGANGKNANAIANKVVSMINSANNRRTHSRSI